MDYSLLLGIEKLDDGVSYAPKCWSMPSKCGKYVYHIGIIDYLSTFRMKKQMEVWAK
jgi:hypothetical protein